MLKVLDFQIGMTEVPDEISLMVGITNCPFRCAHCHTPELQKDIGLPLREVLLDKINQNLGGITCVCFLGGDADLFESYRLSKFIKSIANLKTAIYLGSTQYPTEFLDTFDYIKIGPYQYELGGLESDQTNQKMLKVEFGFPTDITSSFLNDRIDR